VSSDGANTLIDYGDFAVRLAARKDRWSLLKEVLDEWGIDIQGATEPEFTEGAIARAERRLGFMLPGALKEWYALPFRFHRRWPFCGTYIVPASSELGPELSALNGFVRIQREDQDCCQWGFCASDAALQDPPIYNGMDLVFDRKDFSNVQLTLIPQNSTLSEWVLQQTILDAIFIERPRARMAEATPCEKKDLLRGFRRMGFPMQPWGQVDLYGGPNAIVATWPAHAGLAWEHIKATGFHPTLLSWDTWNHHWDLATAGPTGLAVVCRDDATLEQFVNSRGSKWELQREYTPTFSEHTECCEPPYDDPFSDVYGS
jgi:hypothetical protein